MNGMYLKLSSCYTYRMKTNVKIELTDDERNRFAVLFDGKQSKRKVTRAELVDFVDACIDAALDAHPQPDRDLPSVAGDVISDINAGGWTFIGQPPTN